MVVVAVAGLGLLGTGVSGMAGVDARLSDAADRPAVRQIDVRQEIRAPGDCPSRKNPHDSSGREQLQL
jgi:hypothetical protein